MISSHVASDYSEIKLSHINWKQYNLIKKKAMEQEFSWSGLVLSLSIAFFVVIFSSYFLANIYAIAQLGDSEFSATNGEGVYYEAVSESGTNSSFKFSNLS